VHRDDAVVVESTQWNHESAPAGVQVLDNKDFIVDWSRSRSVSYFTLTCGGITIAPTIILHYFGLTGCIIPIADIPTLEIPAMVSTPRGIKTSSSTTTTVLH
jgi:hypothetical protein